MRRNSEVTKKTLTKRSRKHLDYKILLFKKITEFVSNFNSVKKLLNGFVSYFREVEGHDSDFNIPEP